MYCICASLVKLIRSFLNSFTLTESREMEKGISNQKAFIQDPLPAKSSQLNISLRADARGSEQETLLSALFLSGPLYL